MRATAWWAGALLWTGLAVLVAHASEIISPVYVFQAPCGSRPSGEIVRTQILVLDPMPNYIPYRPYAPWGPFQDFEENYASVPVPYQPLPTPGYWLDDIRYPTPGFSPPGGQRYPGPAYPQRYPAGGYAPYRLPAPGYGPHRYPGYNAAGSCGPMGRTLNRLDSIVLPSPGMMPEPCLPQIGDWLSGIPTPPKHVKLPVQGVAMPYFLDYSDVVDVRLPTLEGVRMPTLGDACGPRETGLWSGVKMPHLSVLGNSLNCLQMPTTGFQVPNPSYFMHVLPRPVISIENSIGINVGSQPKGWDPSSMWSFPETCVPQSVLGRMSPPSFTLP
jgi:hypothetical protein